MQLSNATSAIALGEGQEQDYFIYYRQEDQSIPAEVTHIKNHLSVMAINDFAFYCCRQLVIVILNN
jgi:hypothetical protein